MNVVMSPLKTAQPNRAEREGLISAAESFLPRLSTSTFQSNSFSVARPGWDSPARSFLINPKRYMARWNSEAAPVAGYGNYLDNNALSLIYYNEL